MLLTDSPPGAPDSTPLAAEGARRCHILMCTPTDIELGRTRTCVSTDAIAPRCHCASAASQPLAPPRHRPRAHPGTCVSTDLMPLRQDAIASAQHCAHYLMNPPARRPADPPTAQAQGAEAGDASVPIVPVMPAPEWPRDHCCAAPDLGPVMHPTNPMELVLKNARRDGVLGDLPGCEEHTLAESARDERARRRHLLIARSSYDMPRRVVVVVAVVVVRGGGL